MKNLPTAKQKGVIIQITRVAFTRRAMAGLEVAVIGPFETVRVRLVLSKLHGSNVITSFTCGPVPGA